MNLHRCRAFTPRLLATRTIMFALTAVAMVTLLTTSGCQTLGSKKLQKDVATIPPKPDAVLSTTVKSDYKAEIGPDQQFNMHVEMGKVFESQTNYEAAVSEYQKAVDVAQKKSSFLTAKAIGSSREALAERKMAGALDRLGRFTQAETHYSKALKLSPDDAKVWNDAGYSYYLQSRWADAERSLKTADSMDPRNPRILTNLGLTFAAQGKNDEALVAFSHAGGPAVGHANLGYILAAMGKPEQAREYYQKAVELQPELNPARHALAKLDLDAGVRENLARVAVNTKPVAASPYPPMASSPDPLPFLGVKSETPKPVALPLRAPQNLAALPPNSPLRPSVDPRLSRSSSPVQSALEIKPAAVEQTKIIPARPQGKDDYLPPLPPGS